MRSSSSGSSVLPPTAHEFPTRPLWGNLFGYIKLTRLPLMEPFSGHQHAPRNLWLVMETDHATVWLQDVELKTIVTQDGVTYALRDITPGVSPNYSQLAYDPTARHSTGFRQSLRSYDLLEPNQRAKVSKGRATLVVEFSLDAPDLRPDLDVDLEEFLHHQAIKLERRPIPRDLQAEAHTQLNRSNPSGGVTDVEGYVQSRVNDQPRAGVPTGMPSRLQPLLPAFPRARTPPGLWCRAGPAYPPPSTELAIRYSVHPNMDATVRAQLGRHLQSGPYVRESMQRHNWDVVMGVQRAFGRNQMPNHSDWRTSDYYSS